MDTSILCVWLKVAGKETCGSDSDRWTFERVDKKIKDEIAAKTTLVLPLASIIETGNHIAQCNGNRYQLGLLFADLIRKAANEESPWAAFSVQSDLWSDEKLNKLADTWPALAAQKLSLGDVTIKDVAEYYASIQYTSVEIFTGDNGLKAYEPQSPIEQKAPRRKR